MKKLRVRRRLDLSVCAEQSLKKFGVKEGDLLLVGVSGGPDSVCLLHLLKNVSDRFKIRLHIAHLDHGLRGRESLGDSIFVQDMANQWGIPFSNKAVSVSALARFKALSLQVAAREARYLFFERIASKIEARWIVLAHTADDQAETFLLRLFRGAGARGLSSIPSVRNISSHSKEGPTIIRPLLNVRRTEILDYLQTRSLSYREDSSNAKPEYRRNRLRHEVLPLLVSDYNPNLIRTLSRTAELLRDQEDFLTAQAAERMPTLREEILRPGITLNRPKFLRLHRAMQQAVLRESIQQLKGNLVGMSYRYLDDALGLIKKGRSGKYLTMPGYLRITLLYDKVWIHPDHHASYSMDEIILPVPGETYIPAFRSLIKVSLRDQFVLSDPRSCVVFDYAKVHSPFSVRTRRRGDYFFPNGMHGRKKKLQDYFVDQKIPQHERDNIPLLTSSEGLLWVMGWRLDERFIAGPKSRRVMVVELKSEDQAMPVRARGVGEKDVIRESLIVGTEKQFND